MQKPRFAFQIWSNSISKFRKFKIKNFIEFPNILKFPNYHFQHFRENLRFCDSCQDPWNCAEKLPNSAKICKFLWIFLNLEIVEKWCKRQQNSTNSTSYSCRSRKMLKNAPTLAIKGVDITENWPSEIWKFGSSPKILFEFRKFLNLKCEPSENLCWH